MHGLIPPIDLSLTVIVLAFFQILLPIVSVLTGLYFAYMFLTKPGRPIRPLPTVPPVKRILVLAPARNEENVINRLLNSLKAINYPADLIDVLVIADNCSDNTAGVVRAAGFNVVERTDPTGQSKAHALHWAFFTQGYVDAGYDAITILDADTVIDPDFFLYVEERLREGAQIVQGCRKAINAGDSILTSTMSIIYSFESRLWFVTHNNHNRSVSLVGTGSTVTCEHIKKIGFSIRTLVEDSEFSIQSILAGDNIQFSDEAKLWAEIPPTFKLLWRQLRRWFSGQIACGQIYLPALWKKVRQERGGHALMMVFAMIIPFNCTIGLVQIVLSTITMVEMLGGFFSPWMLVTSLLINQIIGMVSAIAILILDSRFNRAHFKEIWKGILLFPFWGPFMGIIYLTSYIHPKKKWDLMDHNVLEPEAQP